MLDHQHLRLAWVCFRRFLKRTPRSISTNQFRVVENDAFARTSLPCAAPDVSEVSDHKRDVIVGYLHDFEGDIERKR